MKIYAHVEDGTIREIVSIDDKLVPGEDLYTPAFAADLVDVTVVTPQPAAGWSYDGRIFAPPAAPPARPRTASTYKLMSALTDAQRAVYANAKPWDQRLFTARDTPWPETNEKIGRIATVIGTTAQAWFDAALGADG